MNATKPIVCDKCKTNITFNDYLSFEKHRWEFHPINEFEIHWSNLKKSGKLYSSQYTMAYQDNPYY